MKKLKLNQYIAIYTKKAGLKAKLVGIVIGIVNYDSYTEYLVKIGNRKYWLEQSNEWKLWKIWPAAKNTRFFQEAMETLEVLKKAKRVESIGKGRGKIKIIERDEGIVKKVEGEVEGIKENEKVEYIDGKFPHRKKWPFFSVEYWGSEVEYYQGMKAKIKRMIEE